MTAEEAAPDAAKADASKADTPRAGGSRLVVGLLGGVAVAAIAVAVLSAQGVLRFGPQESVDVSALEARIQQLETSTENADDAQVRAIEELRTHLASLDARVKAEVARAENSGGAAPVDLSGVEAEIEALKSQLAQVETPQEVEAEVSQEDLEAARQDIANMQRALQGVSSHVETVDRGLAKSDLRLDALEQNAPPSDLKDILNSLSAKSDVEALQTRLVSLEKYNSIEATEKATLALAVADIDEASKGSAPFVTELDAFNILSPGNGTARELRAYAVSGVPTAGLLTEQFKPLMDKAIREDKLAGADNLAEKSLAKFSTTFDIRRVGEVEGTSTKAVLSRAELRVGVRDLDAAAKELEALEGAAAEVFAGWVHDVKARARVNGLVSKLNASVLADLNAALKAAEEQ